MERDKTKSTHPKGPDSSRGSLTKSNVKVIKEKLVREDIEASHSSHHPNKQDSNTTSLLSTISPTNKITIDLKSATQANSQVNTPDIPKHESHSEKVSSSNSQENLLSATPTGNTTPSTIPVHQISTILTSNTANNQVAASPQHSNLTHVTQTSPVISATSLKSLKKKETAPASPKTASKADAGKVLKQNASPKSYMKLKTEKAQLIKKKPGTTSSAESPGKEMPVRNSFVNTSQENVLDVESMTQSAVSQPESNKNGGEFVKYYKQERPKLNIWTYLFKNLNTAISQIYTMCDMENITDFNNGVISTLETAIEDIKKLNKKIELDSIKSIKPLVWDIAGTSSEIQNKQEIENFLEDVEDPDTVDFTLLTQMIQDGKMSLQEAIVLLVRERALLIDDNAVNFLSNSAGINSDNLSFTSKINQDFSIEFQKYSPENPRILNSLRDPKDAKDSKDSKEESLIPPFPIVEEDPDLLRRSRSQTPGRVSLVKLINRLNWKLQDKKKDVDEGYASEEYTQEEHKNRLTQKQLKAETKRKELEALKQDSLQKEFNKISEARENKEKLAKEQSKKLEAFSKKLSEAESRYEAKISEKKKKAKNEIDKVNEVAFIGLLEKQTKKLTLDLRVKETRERRLQIIEQIKQKQMGRSVKEDAVAKRRAAQQKETEGKLKSKLEEAENRRNKIYEEKKKVLEEESRKLADVTNRKKILGYKDIHFKKGEENTHKTRIEHLKAVLLEEQQKLHKKLSKKPTRGHQDQPVRKESYAGSSSDDDLSFVKIKRARSVKTEDEYEGDIILGDQPILFYEPRSKIKEQKKEEEKPVVPQAERARKKGKKKPKKKDNEAAQKDEEDVRTILGLIRSFSQPNLKTPKLKDLRLKLENTEEKEVIEEKKPVPQAKTPKVSTPVSSGSIKKFEKLELQSKSFKEKDKEKESSAKKGLSKARSIGSSSSETLFGTTSEDKRIGRAASGSVTHSSGTLRKERNSVTEKEEAVAPEGETSITLNIDSKEKNVAVVAKNGDNENETTATGMTEREEKDTEEEEEHKEETGEAGDDQMIRWCSICDLILAGDTGNDEHIGSKQHKKVKTQYNLSNSDDLNCILEFKQSDINSKLKAERWNTLKKRCKKIKQRLVTRALKKENTVIMGKDKEFTSINKQRLQKLCLELDKQVATQIKDYDIVDNILRDILKLLDNQKEADLHIMRQLKFIPILMEICKRVSVCHKNEQDALLRALDSAIKILSKFCGLIDNRTYMILTNRLVPLVDLLIWCLNRPTKFVYSLTFVPHLFTILGRHLNHRMLMESEGYKEDIIEYIFCSGLIMKLWQRFMTFNGGLDLTTSMGKVPLALLKSVSFLEILTSVVDVEFNIERSIFDPPVVSENIMIALKETEFIGMFALLASLLLSDPSYTKQPSKTLPQTVLSVAMTTVKFFNNVARIMLEPFQALLGSKDLQEQVKHVFSYLLAYCNQNYDSSEDVKDLLDELILMIGYFCVLNPANQELLGEGLSTVIQKLTDLPFPYFTDKKMKDILFPTFFCAVFKNRKNLDILYKDVTREHLDKFLQSQIQLFPLDFITEKEEGTLTPSNNESSHNLGLNPFGAATEPKSNKHQGMKFLRNLSVSSNTSSATSLFNVKASNSHHFLLVCRFPRNKWDELLEFINIETEK